MQNPFDSHTLILKTEVLVVTQPSSIGVGEDVDSIVNGHDDMALRTMDPVRWQLGGNVDATSDVSTACHEKHRESERGILCSEDWNGSTTRELEFGNSRSAVVRPERRRRPDPGTQSQCTQFRGWAFGCHPASRDSPGQFTGMFCMTDVVDYD